jgi:hypothetical protein
MNIAFVVFIAAFCLFVAGYHGGKHLAKEDNAERLIVKGG